MRSTGDVTVSSLFVWRLVRELAQSAERLQRSGFIAHHDARVGGRQCRSLSDCLNILKLGILQPFSGGGVGGAFKLLTHV